MNGIEFIVEHASKMHKPLSALEVAVISLSPGRTQSQVAFELGIPRAKVGMILRQQKKRIGT